MTPTGRRQATLAVSSKRITFGGVLATPPGVRRKKASPSKDDAAPRRTALDAWLGANQNIGSISKQVAPHTENSFFALGDGSPCDNSGEHVVSHGHVTASVPVQTPEATTDTEPSLPHTQFSSKDAYSTEYVGFRPDQVVEERAIDAWLGDDDQVLYVEDITSSGDKIQAWPETGDSILLSNDAYLDTSGLTTDSLDELNYTEAPPFPNPEHHSALADIYRRIAEALGPSWTQVKSFIAMTAPTESDQELMDTYQDFLEAEVKISGWNPAHIVRPSGSRNARLHLMLHYPTFTTENPDYGETADATNVCINLLLRKGLSAQNAFWYEAYFRRQVAAAVRHHAIAAQFWPEAVRQHHEKFSLFCQQQAKTVLVVFGAANRKAISNRYWSEKYTVTEYRVRITATETVVLGVVRCTDGLIDHLLIFCPHPEWLLHNWTFGASRYFDSCINVAAVLSGAKVDADYFERRAVALSSKVTSHDTPLAEAQEALGLERLNGVLCHPENMPLSVDQFVTENHIDRKELVQMYEAGKSVLDYLYPTIQKAQPMVKQMRREKIDRSVLRKRLSWFKDLPENAYSDNCRAIVQAAQHDDALTAGQILCRPTLFSNTHSTYLFRPSYIARSAESLGVPSTEDLSPESQSTGGLSPARPSSDGPAGTGASIAGTGFGSAFAFPIPKGVTIVPKVSKSKNILINTAVIHHGRSIALKCIKCGLPPARKPIDSKPEFCTQSHVSGRYIARAQVCETASCQEGWKKENGRSGRRMMMIPQDASIGFIRSDQLQELDY